MIDIPERSSAAKIATSVLYEDFNDVDIYIEDTALGYEKIFNILLTRLLADQVTITKIFPLGSRQEVIKRAHESESRGRREVYLVDGDLYLMTGEFEVLPKNVVPLHVYCIENFLVDSHSIVNCMDDEDPEQSYDVLREKLAYEKWKEASLDALRSLFIIYAAAHALRSGIPTTSRKKEDFVANGSGDLDQRKICAVVDEIRNALILQFGSECVQSTIDAINARIDHSRCFIGTYVSAKNYTLPIIFQRMRAITKITSPHLALKIRLAKSCDLEMLHPLGRAISDVIGLPSAYKAFGAA
ncbi:DUF4435 domain-containing protein [Cupriavidus sp. 2MCAB6]|uniref:DUF4435 domain-containing protein n=1 Tax=Cupriavidus sp. 2MCAB6 TaxID=3232981 RepID=UPI003F8DE28E